MEKQKELNKETKAGDTEIKPYGLESKKFNVDMGYHRIIDGVVEEVDIEGNIYRLVKPEAKPEHPITEIKPKKRRPKGVIGFSQTYETNIIRDEVNKVMMSLQHVRLGYKPTAEAISNETGLKQYRIWAILGWLKREGVVKRVKDEEGTPIYRIVKKDWKP